MTNKYTHIEELLDRFFDGQTSNEEERLLYDFFNKEAIPAHLRQYKPVFCYFETELKQELGEPEKTNIVPDRSVKKRRIIRISIAASFLALLALSPLLLNKEKPFNPYEGSYIVRNGVRITDPDIIRPELEATVRQVMLQQEREEGILTCLSEKEDRYARLEQQLEQSYSEIINSFPEGYVREEVKRILETE